MGFHWFLGFFLFLFEFFFDFFFGWRVLCFFVFFGEGRFCVYWVSVFWGFKVFFGFKGVSNGFQRGFKRFQGGFREGGGRGFRVGLGEVLVGLGVQWFKWFKRLEGLKWFKGIKKV